MVPPATSSAPSTMHAMDPEDLAHADHDCVYGPPRIFAVKGNHDAAIAFAGDSNKSTFRSFALTPVIRSSRTVDHSA